VFELKAMIPVTDHSNEPPGRMGGDNGHGQDLPPIRYGKPPINTIDPRDPKIQGGLRAQIDGDEGSESEDSCPTDSFEDEAGESHRLTRIANALHKKLPVMVSFTGFFNGYQDIQSN
jgi:hypothetical protein